MSNRFWIALLAMVYIMLYVSFPKHGFWGDVAGFFAKWSIHIQNHGMSQAYIGSDVNYTPGYLYLLQIYGWIQGSAESINASIWYLKTYTLIFDLGAIYALVQLLRRWALPTKGALLILLNIAYLYNTYIWGQIDAIYTTLIFLAAYAAIEKRPVLAVLLFIASMSVKLQTIVALPALGLFLLPQFYQSPKKIVHAVIGATILQVLIFLPFIVNGTFESMWNIYRNSGDHFPIVQANAFNFWHLLKGTPYLDIWATDHQMILGLKVKIWGFLMFFLFGALAVIPWAKRVWHRMRSRTDFTRQDHALLFLTLTLCTLVFFYFNTQMHDRYSHPVVLFSGIYALLTRRWIMYVLLSAAYLLNMEQVLKYMQLNSYNTFIFETRLTSSFFLISLILGLRWAWLDRIIVRNDVPAPSGIAAPAKA